MIVEGKFCPIADFPENPLFLYLSKAALPRRGCWSCLSVRPSPLFLPNLEPFVFPAPRSVQPVLGHKQIHNVRTSRFCLSSKRPFLLVSVCVVSRDVIRYYSEWAVHQSVPRTLKLER